MFVPGKPFQPRKCLSMASLYSQVLCLWVRPGTHPIVEHQKGASLWYAPERLASDNYSRSLRKSVNYSRKEFYGIGPRQNFTRCSKLVRFSLSSHFSQV
jgi:hypothetical protein